MSKPLVLALVSMMMCASAGSPASASQPDDDSVGNGRPACQPNQPCTNPTAGITVRPPRDFSGQTIIRNTGSDSVVANAGGSVALPGNTIVLPGGGGGPPPPPQLCLDSSATNFGLPLPCQYGTAPPNTCPPAPPVIERTVTCPSGQSGTFIERQNFTLSPHPTCWVAQSSWTVTQNNCTGGVGNTCGPAPLVPPSQTVGCPSGQIGQVTQQGVWVSAPAPQCWTEGGPWSSVANTCVPDNQTCPSAPTGVLPAPRFDACGGGQFGAGVTTSYSWSLLPAPSCWSAIPSVNDQCFTPCLQWPPAGMDLDPRDPMTATSATGRTCWLRPGGMTCEFAGEIRDFPCP